MKLKELLTLLHDAGCFNDDGILTCDKLKKIKNHLMSCDEFIEVKELNFIENPIFEIGDKKFHSQTFKLVDDLMFGDIIYIHSIVITPEMYSPHHWVNDTLEKGAAITPVVYDPETFVPKRRIVIEFNPETNMDRHRMENIKESTDLFKKDELLKKFMHVLENPSDYIIKGFREFTIRGINLKSEL